MTGQTVSEKDFAVPILGEASNGSPLVEKRGLFIIEADRVLYSIHTDDLGHPAEPGSVPASFAGILRPRGNGCQAPATPPRKAIPALDEDDAQRTAPSQWDHLLWCYGDQDTRGGQQPVL